MLWMESVALSSRRVWQKLLPLLPNDPLPGRLMSFTDVPEGDVRVTIKSPTNVWSMPTPVAPSSVEQ